MEKSCYYLSTLCWQFGRQVSLSEAHTLEFVARNSQVPVPRVITAFQTKNGQRCILMGRIPGVPLCSKFDHFSEETQRNIYRQLQRYTDQLRAIPPPKSGFVGAVDLGPIRDDRVYSGPPDPFNTVQEFHKALRDGIEENSGHVELDKMIERENGRDYSCRLTHGDLSFRNIIVQGETLTGIVDWETAEWHPDYWEYTITLDSFYDCTNQAADR